MRAGPRAKIYLSIDLDYFDNRCSEDPASAMLAFMERVHREVPLEVPVRVVRDHHWLLSSFRDLRFGRLINFDFHSDLTDEGVHNPLTGEDLNCGTWVNFVPGQQHKQYVWSPPAKWCTTSYPTCLCNGKRHNPFWNHLYHGWRQVGYRVYGLDDVDLKRVIGIGISRSPTWTSKWVQIMWKRHQRRLFRGRPRRRR